MRNWMLTATLCVLVNTGCDWPQAASALIQTGTELLAAVSGYGGSGGCYVGPGSYGDCGPRTVFVQRYYRPDGTYVEGYWRSPPGSCP